MPVTLKLSDEEARDLAEMLSTAATVAASNQQDGAEARLAAWGNLVSRLMKELSVTSKLKGRIAYADELGGYAFTREYEESAFFQDCLDEYRDNSFWADLVTRMADKAISEHLGPEYFENMPDVQSLGHVHDLSTQWSHTGTTTNPGVSWIIGTIRS